MPTTAALPSPVEATGTSRTTNNPAPLTSAGLSTDADIPLSQKIIEIPNDAGRPSLFREQLSSKGAKTLTPLKTAGVSNSADFSSPSKTAGSPRTPNTPFSLKTFGPSIQAERRFSSKPVDSTKTQSIIPASLQTAEFPRVRDKRSRSNTVEIPNNVEVPSPLTRPGSSRSPSFIAELKQRRIANEAVASLGACLEPATFPTYLNTPIQDTGTDKEQPKTETLAGTDKDRLDPETLAVFMELPDSSAEDQKLPVPKIFVERASDAPDVDDSWSTRLPTIEEKSQEGKLKQALTRVLSSGAAGSKAPSAGLRSPTLPQIAENSEEPKTPNVKRRKLYLRKARNAAARKPILKAALGRELANDTKPVLRRLAHGEPYDAKSQGSHDGASSQDHVRVRVRVKAS